MVGTLILPVIDLSADDKVSTANSVHQACTDIGFFYVINHGVDKDMLKKLFFQSKNFFSLPLEAKMKLERKEHRGYTPIYSEKLDPLSNHAGDSKESFYIGPLEDCLNHWPSEGTDLPQLSLLLRNSVHASGSLIASLKNKTYTLPEWHETMEAYYKQVLLAGKRLLSLIALALDLDKHFFEEVGALKRPYPFLRLLHYPGGSVPWNGEYFGASAHSDYGMITLLATDGVPGLQVCREKDCQPRIWEEVPHIDGALIVNIGDMLERWTDCRFRSTLHRVMSTGQERCSAAFFLDPNSDCVVECLESCCSDSSPPKFPPIRSGDYLEERLRATYT